MPPAAWAERTSTELSHPGPVAAFLQYRGRIIGLYRSGPQLIATVRDESQRDHVVWLSMRDTVVWLGRNQPVDLLQEGAAVDICQATRPDGSMRQLVTILPPPGTAEVIEAVASPHEVDDVANDEIPFPGPLQKLSRGLANMVTGILEIPRNVWIMRYERGRLAAATGGLLKGVWFTGTRVLAGAYDVATFPIPLPFHYEPVLQPEFVWEQNGVSLLDLRELVREWSNPSGG